MSSFYSDNVKKKVFNDFSSYVTKDSSIKVIQNRDANFLFRNQYDEIWEIETGLYDDENQHWLVEEIKIYIAFKNSFPSTLPKIYFDQNDFNKLGYIPHITYASCNICVSDEFVIVDENRPVEIILFQYNKAKLTLIEGLKGINDKDFENEFLAYWEIPHDKSDKVDLEKYYTIIEDEPENYDDLSLIYYRPKNKVKDDYKAIIYSKKETHISSYKEYFKKNSFDTVENSCFYVGEIEGFQKPPFSKTCGESLSFIPENLKNNFRKYVNTANPFRLVVFKKIVKGKNCYLGWRYPNFKTKMNGFRENRIPFYNAAFNKSLPHNKKSIHRFSTSELNLRRLQNRTASTRIKIPKYQFLFAGLGSVGSFLIQQMNNINFPSFTLVDNDNLSEENIGRHLLGFSNIGVNKAVAIQDFLCAKLPSQKTTSFPKPVVELFEDNKEVFNSQDYIFICIGKQNVEKWFIEKLRNKELTKPIFIIWVEPYLLGGHCLFLHPSNDINIEDLFYDVFKFRHSIINPEEFEKKRELFTLKEKGCQATYSPYSSAHLSLFISSIYSKIFQIIEQKKIDNMIISWCGDFDIAQRLNIDLNVSIDDKYKMIEKKL